MRTLPRVIIAVVVLIVAFLLHLGLTTWGWKQTYISTVERPRPLLFGVENAPPGNNPGFSRASGLFVPRDTSRAAAVTLGVAVPIGLIGFNLAFIVHGVQARRRARGLCPKCGYDLRGNTARCSECGWARSTASETTSA